MKKTFHELTRTEKAIMLALAPLALIWEVGRFLAKVTRSAVYLIEGAAIWWFEDER